MCLGVPVDITVSLSYRNTYSSQMVEAFLHVTFHQHQHGVPENCHGRDHDQNGEDERADGVGKVPFGLHGFRGKVAIASELKKSLVTFALTLNLMM